MTGDARRDTDRIDVAYVARLARLSLTEEEVRTFAAQLREIVDYVRKINELDVRGIEPTSHAHPVTNVLRKDEVRPGLEREAVLANAPAHAQAQVLVPKIVE
jgi:aspartyl-tRNA(Asn)/glutamyl-tRNA(Gln) amidotransferase subunit C